MRIIDQSAAMRYKPFIIIISLIMGLNLVFGAACAASTLPIDKTACKKTKLFSTGATETAGKCHLQTCQNANGRLFIVPQGASKLAGSEKRVVLSLPAVFWLVDRVSDRFQFKKAAPKVPLPYEPPPIICILCTYLC